FESAKSMNRSLNAEIVARIEQTFSQNKNDFNAGYNACMVHMLIATTKALTAKGIPWDEVQKALIEVVDDFDKLSKEKKAP
ncbi:MAG: Arc family DNA-binding protein, partial [Shewanella sp.]|nr:Arc family DNA-binding protein [Shewanella sp.]